MKILHAGWWTLEYRKAGGSIIHVETLMEELAKRGHSNVYFCGGRYNLFSKKTYLKKWKKLFTQVYEVVNSPNLICAYDSVPYHIKSNILDKLFQFVLDKEKPDIVHFHELESLTGSLLTLTRKRNIPFVIGIHNYWYLCPQRDLFDMTGKVCDDFQGGVKCATCRILPQNSKFGWMYVGYIRNTMIGRRLERFAKFVYRILAKRQNLSKKPSSLPPHLFRQRRDFFVEELNRASAIIFPSKRTQEVYAQYGVNNSTSFVMMELNKNYNQIMPKPPLRPRGEKVVFGYIGSVLKTKGVHLILEATELLSSLQDAFDVFIFGGGDEVYIEELKERARRSNVFFKGPYNPDAVQTVLDTIDVAIVPSMWEDCAPIVLNELRLSRTPIIGSRIGGIEETIRHGITGFLFEPGNAKELAGYMESIIRKPSTIRSFMEASDFSFDMEQYMVNLIKAYEHICRNS